MSIDFLIHDRLSKARFVSLVMTIPTIANQIDNEVLAELLAIGKGVTRGFHTSEWIIRIDMDHGDFKSFCEIAGMKTAPRLTFGGCETKLIIGNNMQTAACGIPGHM